MNTVTRPCHFDENDAGCREQLPKIWHFPLLGPSL